MTAQLGVTLGDGVELTSNLIRQVRICTVLTLCQTRSTSTSMKISGGTQWQGLQVLAYPQIGELVIIEQLSWAQWIYYLWGKIFWTITNQKILTSFKELIYYESTMKSHSISNHTVFSTWFHLGLKLWLLTLFYGSGRLDTSINPILL